MTECNQNEFAFAPHFSRQVSARFSERQLSTEGGALLLRETDRKIGLLSRVRKCFSDYRNPVFIEHALGELLANPLRAAGFGAAARRRVDAEFSRDAMRARFESFYKELAGK